MTTFRSKLINQLVLHYQPVYDINRFEAIGFEALCRLSSNSDGQLSYPSTFMPHLSMTNLIGLDLRVISKALYALSNSQLGLVFINLDGLLYLPRKRLIKLINILHYCCNALDIMPSQVIFEISESVSFVGRDYIYDAISHIKQYGFKLAIDDYGKENSNIVRLCTMPCDYLKIDKSITDLLIHTEFRSKAGAIIQSIKNVCSDHDIQVICEGVETAAQHRYLVDIGQSLAQGFFYSKPICLNKLNLVMQPTLIKSHA
ncbi:EAL domain-containing protein [Shewanella xiamenensis]|uniref:EAL domain-containing protein n=1 Tax=Shewanella xiamenensis TaxID=332186 RepID=A0ABT6UFZ1_9GAMM|nr:EAL domain-containing protein [Shewanella xiamenensis]MDI5833326.1 EAL domain-containing protein [Shewanella xiamenensis]